jgi:hypothetical protein
VGVAMVDTRDIADAVVAELLRRERAPIHCLALPSSRRSRHADRSGDSGDLGLSAR